MSIISNKSDRTNRTNRSGQALLLVVVMMGGILFLVTAVAGLLMYYQVEQSNDTAHSAVSIFAADAGLERGLYYYFYEYDPKSCNPTNVCTIGTGGPGGYFPTLTAVTFANGATASTTIVIPAQSKLEESVSVSGSGMDAGGRTIRALQTNFLLNP